MTHGYALDANFAIVRLCAVLTHTVTEKVDFPKDAINHAQKESGHMKKVCVHYAKIMIPKK